NKDLLSFALDDDLWFLQPSHAKRFSNGTLRKSERRQFEPDTESTQTSSCDHIPSSNISINRKSPDVEDIPRSIHQKSSDNAERSQSSKTPPSPPPPPPPPLSPPPLSPPTLTPPPQSTFSKYLRFQSRFQSSPPQSSPSQSRLQTSHSGCSVRYENQGGIIQLFPKQLLDLSTVLRYARDLGAEDVGICKTILPVGRASQSEPLRYTAPKGYRYLTHR
ncbi:hypothetical protein MMC16_007415, partial [Acarospora aff. strigata]|nr:hypothetical protein [Acarospora aff. strigata]